MGTEKKDNDINVNVHLFVHYDKPDKEIIKEIKELKLLIIKNHKIIMANYAQFEGLLTTIAQGVADLKTAIQNAGLTTQQEDALMAKAQEIANSFTAAVPGITQYTSNANLYLDENGDLTDEETDTLVFESDTVYNVSASEPLTLTGANGEAYDITDWKDSFTAVPA